MGLGVRWRYRAGTVRGDCSLYLWIRQSLGPFRGEQTFDLLPHLHSYPPSSPALFLSLAPECPHKGHEVDWPGGAQPWPWLWAGAQEWLTERVGFAGSLTPFSAGHMICPPEQAWSCRRQRASRGPAVVPSSSHLSNASPTQMAMTLQDSGSRNVDKGTQSPEDMSLSLGEPPNMKEKKSPQMTPKRGP